MEFGGSSEDSCAEGPRDDICGVEVAKTPVKATTMHPKLGATSALRELKQRIILAYSPTSMMISLHL